jgi:FKBP-type peptidyl-prolyl cis-trans isomerase FkpA
MGSFAVMILNTKNTQQDDQRKQQLAVKYQEDLKDRQEKIDARTALLSKKYYPVLKKYATIPSKYSLDSVQKLKTDDLYVGSGKKITKTTPVALYYIGWNPDGKIFDQSIDGESLKAPLYESDPTNQFVGLENGIDEASLIQGWKDGVVGMNIGGVREISIPSDLAYGESGQGNDIPPNTPIKFIVLAINPPEAIPVPEIPQELLQQ